MMRTNILFLIFMPIMIYTQTKRFFYKVSFRTNAEQVESTLNDIVILDINDKENYFYSNEYLYIDSINLVKNKRQFAYPKFNKIIKWNKSKNEFEMINNLSMNFYIYKSKRQINWTLLEEKKKIGDYLVQKAIGSYGGRNWIAWFANDIPLPFGPYIFYGLPGLILELYDDEKNYNFTFIQNKNYNETFENEKLLKKYLGVRKFEIEEKDWKKIQINYYENPIPEYKDGNAMIMKDDGAQYTQTDYRNLENNIKNNIKRNNNPIELTEKINYK